MKLLRYLGRVVYWTVAAILATFIDLAVITWRNARRWAREVWGSLRFNATAVADVASNWAISRRAKAKYERDMRAAMEAKLANRVARQVLAERGK